MNEIHITQSAVTVVVDANAASATVSWPYEKTCIQNNCRTWKDKGMVTRTIPLSANTTCEENTISGTVTWNGIVLVYKITQKPADCSSCNCDGLTLTMCGDIIDSWIDNPLYKCDNPSDTERTLYYTYPIVSYGAKPYYEVITSSTNVTITGDCDTVGPIPRITTTSVTLLDGSKANATYSYTILPSTKCKEGEVRLQLSRVEYDTESLLSSGGTVNGNIYYNKYTYHDDCTSSRNEMVSAFTWNIEECDCSANTCCNDHYETSSLTINYPYRVEETDSAATLDVQLSMLIVGDDGTVHCSNCAKPTCTPSTTYRIDPNNVQAYYKRINETTLLEEWYSGGTLPQNGGEIKAGYFYSAITVNSNCVSSVTSGLSALSYVVKVDAIDCGNESRIVSSTTSANTQHGIINSFEYQQQQNKCGESSETTKIEVTKYKDVTVPCDLTGTSAICVPYETIVYEYDEYGNIISVTPSGSGTSCDDGIDYNVDFGSGMNCSQTTKVVSSFTEGFSVSKAGGCYCPPNSGITIDITNPPYPLKLSGDGETWFIPCCITGDVSFTIQYAYYEYDGCRKMVENKSYSSNTVTFENANIDDNPSQPMVISYDKFNLKECKFESGYTLTIKDVGNCCNNLTIEIQD